jgi:hypothetical protein
VAAKRFYFGVGGGTAAFVAQLDAKHTGLRHSVARVFEDGSSNIREIVLVQHVKA